MRSTLRLTLTTAALLALPPGLALYSYAQQHMETSTFNQGPVRPKENPATVAHGKQVYEQKCAKCHADDLRGAMPDGVNILRSQYSLTDKAGDTLVPVMQGQVADVPDHKIAISTDDAKAVAAYIRTLVAQIGSQGRPPGESSRSPNILVGNAAKGQQYFTAHCASCHSVDGDLKGFGKKLGTPKALQSAWLRGSHLGSPAPDVTATVTEPGKPEIEGVVIHIDDFLLTVKLKDGSMLTIRRNGAVPKVVVHDPLEAHRNMLPVLTDSDVHNITAFLVTLK